MADAPQCGIDLIKQRENCELETYLDDKGVPTIAWGHTANVQMGDACTKEQADAWLAQDVAWAWAAIQAHVTVPLSDNQAGALLSFVYNLGEPKFMASTLLAQLNTGCYACVPGQMMRWDKETRNGVLVVDNGLINRRKAEVALWTAA